MPTEEEAQKDLESRKFSDIRREIAQLWKAINALRKARHRRKKRHQKESSQPEEAESSKQDNQPSIADEFNELLQAIK